MNSSVHQNSVLDPKCRIAVAVIQVKYKSAILGPTQVLGGSFEKGGFAYQLPGVDPLVFPAKKLLVSRSQSQALGNTLHLIDYATGLPTTVSIVGLSNSHATLATNPQGINREVSTEAVTARIHADSAGLIVMQNSYLPGMSCAANGQRTKCVSVDGGLWTAVYVPAVAPL